MVVGRSGKGERLGGGSTRVGVKLEGPQDCPWLGVFWMGLELRVAEGPEVCPLFFPVLWKYILLR